MHSGKILYVGGFKLPDRNAAAHRVINNGKLLRDIGYEVFFLGVDERNSDYLSMTKKSFFGFDCYSIPYPNNIKQWLKYLTSIFWVKKIVSDIQDISCVIVYNYQAIALLRLSRFCRKNNISIVGDSTEWYGSKGENFLFKILKGLDTFLRMRILQKQMNGLIVISSYLTKYYRTVRNLLCLPPLVDKLEYKWVQNELQVNFSKIRLVYAGTPGKTKDNLGLLIECLYDLKHYSNFEFIIVGISKEEYLSNNCQKKIIDDLGNKVVFKGRVPHQTSINLLKGSDFSIFLRQKTRTNMAGFPTKLVESISSGTPVITTNTSDISKYIINMKNGIIVDQLNKESLLTVLRNLLSLDIKIIRGIKENVDATTFHYMNYCDQMKKFISQSIKGE